MSKEPEICTAIRAGDFAAVQRCVRNGADVSATDDCGFPCLHIAVHYDQEDILRFLLAKGAKVDQRYDASRDSALHIAARRGHIGILNLLLEQGAIVDATNCISATPLAWAIKADQVETARILFWHGADLRKGDMDGTTPGHYIKSDAMRQMLAEEKEKLMRYKATVTQRPIKIRPLKLKSNTGKL